MTSGEKRGVELPCWGWLKYFDLIGEFSYLAIGRVYSISM